MEAFICCLQQGLMPSTFPGPLDPLRELSLGSPVHLSPYQAVCSYTVYMWLEGGGQGIECAQSPSIG